MPITQLNIDDLDTRFSYWRVAFPNHPVNINLINNLPGGWGDNSYHHDESPSLLWEVGKMSCCQLYFNKDKLSLLNVLDDKWTTYSLTKRGEIYDLKELLEWLLLRMKALDYVTKQKVGVLNSDVLSDLVGDFCNEYLKDKDLGIVAEDYWPGEIIGEVLIKFGFE